MIAALTSWLDSGKNMQAGKSASLAASQYVVLVFSYKAVSSGLLSVPPELDGEYASRDGVVE
jgi:hypothetical protein